MPVITMYILIVVVSALCADFEPQARHCDKLGHRLVFAWMAKETSHIVRHNSEKRVR
jgi:hypothetical protein